MKKDRPIIVVGNPRSGTTLFRLLLTTHSKIVIPPECGFMVWWHKKYKNWGSGNKESEINKFLDDLVTSKKFETWRITKMGLKRQLISKRPEDYAMLVAEIYLYYAKKQNKGVIYWGDKNNYYLHHIDEINKIYPKCFFIHVVRDGRDVAISYKNLKKLKGRVKYAPSLPTSTKKIAREWRDNIIKIKTSLQKINKNRVCEIRYEDLVQKPQECLNKICKFLGLRYEKEMLDFYKHNKKRELEPREFVLWKGKTLKPINTKNIGLYKKLMTEREVIQFEAVAGELLKVYGYL